MLTTRRVSKQIHVGNVAVGGDARVTVQSMTKTDTRDVAATVEQIRGLEEAGCDIVRAAVPDMEAAQALAEIKRRISIPLIADIHFHYQLALESLKSGVDCLRLNPGNIRDRSRVEEIVREAKARQVPIRIGVNFGSLPPVGKIGGRGTSRHLDGVNKLPKPNEAQPGDYTVVDHMVETGLWEIGILEDLDFDLIKISMKAFDIDTTVEAYRRMAEIVPYPLHLGITEAGTARSGSIRSAIGSRARCSTRGSATPFAFPSATTPPKRYTRVWRSSSRWSCARRGQRLSRVPSCGRADVDVRKLANTVDNLLRQHKTPIKVAVMGCEVNGPGEAKDADVGIAAGVGRAIIFRKGQKARIVAEDDMLTALMEEVGKAEAEIL